MTRPFRIVVSLMAVMASVVLVLGLVLLGNVAEGPLTSSLEAVGRVVAGTEARVRQLARGPGRESRLVFLQPLRQSADALRDPPFLLLGAYDGEIPVSLEGVTAFESALGEPLPLIQIYTAWGDRNDQRFPDRIVRSVWSLGSIPLITWEPWLTDFENRLHPHIPLRDDRDRGGLDAIAAGTYDFYVDAWAREATRFGRPMMVRFAHEMNDPYRYPWGPHNNTPESFVAAWRRVVERFRAAGAHNVVWVWSPHVAYEGWEAYYPGDDVVDWVGTGVLNYGTVAYWSQWWSFDEIFGRHHPGLASFGKPIMIAEFGSLTVGGDRASWYDEALRSLPERYPGVRALLFFQVEDDRTVTYQGLDWTLTGDSLALSAVRDAIESW